MQGAVWADPRCLGRPHVGDLVEDGLHVKAAALIDLEAFTQQPKPKLGRYDKRIGHGNLHKLIVRVGAPCGADGFCRGAVSWGCPATRYSVSARRPYPTSTRCGVLVAVA